MRVATKAAWRLVMLRTEPVGLTPGRERGTISNARLAEGLGRGDLNKRRVKGSADHPVDAVVLGGRALGLGRLDGEFDPGSGQTLAACLKHASRTARKGSGRRLRNA